jgi:nucleoside-diphosphate-sugar epimerase
MTVQLLIFGLGYVGKAVADEARASGIDVTGTSRSGPEAPGIVRPEDVPGLLSGTTHLMITAAPGEGGDPLLALPGAEAALAAGPLRWIGYLSTTGVYGDRGGDWVNEATAPAPGSERARRRVTAEEAWSRYADRCAVDVFRLAGIYGPGRSALDDVRAGRARRIIKPGHCFGRIHRDDIVQAVMAAIAQNPPPGRRVFNLSDDEPAETALVIAEAAALTGAPLPPAVPFEQAWEAMSPMAESFWAENRKVGNAATKAALGIAWRYPSYREGLRAILSEERGEGRG